MGGQTLLQINHGMMFALMHFETTIDSSVELTRAFSPYINYEQDRDLKIKIVFVSVVYSLLLALGALSPDNLFILSDNMMWFVDEL